MSMRHFWSILKRVVGESDAVIEVLDARMPHLTRNAKAEAIVEESGKPLILALNKVDLVSDATAKKHKRELDKEHPTVFVSSRKRFGVSILKRKVFEILKKGSSLNVGKRLHIGVIGYPNTGKSSLINALAGRNKAPTGPRPGQTRGQQWVRLAENMYLIDTPGVIPLTEEDSELKHALIGSMDPSKIEDLEDVAREIVGIFSQGSMRPLERLYGINAGKKEFEELIEEIGRSRNLLRKGGKVDENRVYFTLINDWQRGKLLLQ